MSLDCYPLKSRRTIELREQPIGLDVAYDEDLLITVVDDCRRVLVLDLGFEDNNQREVGRFRLGENTVIDQVIYCKQGDYIACVGHNNDQVSLYAVSDWRDNRDSPLIDKLDPKEMTVPFDEVNRSDKLNSIDACQKTGNLAASYGDLVVIYQLVNRRDRQQNQSLLVSSPSGGTIEELEELTLNDAIKQRCRSFRHLVSVKLAMWASRVCLAENYLSIMAIDHVQVLKLELLTLQIQSDGLDGDRSLLCAPGQQQVNRSAGSSEESQAGMIAGRQRGGLSANCSKSGGVGGTAVGCVSDSASGDEETNDSCSMTSGMTSNQSTRTNFSSFLATDNDEEAETNSTTTNNTSGGGPADDDDQQLAQPLLTNIDSDMSIITMNDTLSQGLDSEQQQRQEQQDQQLAQNQAVVSSQDDCITWNLNTKKLVKLPTLMQNTSTDLSSFHICHPLELLGPASESIACRVTARIYSPELGQNQLEPVVLLCKQFDFDRDPVKLVYLQTVYLASQEDQKRLSRASATAVTSNEPQHSSTITPHYSGADQLQRQFLKSADHELLTSVCCFVATLTNCFVYSLQGKKVVRLQTITHPGLCLDLRVDLLNVLLLTPLGLQICSTNVCDTTFRYDWSSSADLNLIFVACNRTRVLTTSRHIVMISSAPAHKDPDKPSRHETACFVEVLQKPSFCELDRRIEHTIQRCQSISIRSNLLTYLHATAQLSVIAIERRRLQANEQQVQTLAREVPSAAATDLQLPEAITNLRQTALLLARQLLQKKQTNVITNGRIDKTIKHLLDNSYCDLAELMQRHLSSSDGGNSEADRDQRQNRGESFQSADEYDQEPDDLDLDEQEEEPADSDFELLRIFLRHTKFNQNILDYVRHLLKQSSDNQAEQVLAFERLVSYMFDYNPRLLIKCAQRVTRDYYSTPNGHLVQCLVEKLTQLAQFDSTGINRATVLFTLAILHHATRRQEDDAKEHEKCLVALSQIKPLNHLAITMCSNHEIISPSMARLVHANHPQVFRLFLNQLQKRGDLLAAREFELLVSHEKSRHVHEALVDTANMKSQIEAAQDEHNNSADVNKDQDEDDEHEEQFEQTLRLLAEVSPVELADFFCRELELEQEEAAPSGQESGERTGNTTNKLVSHDDAEQAIRAYLMASINLMESKFILARLSENSR